MGKAGLITTTATDASDMHTWHSSRVELAFYPLTTMAAMTDRRTYHCLANVMLQYTANLESVLLVRGRIHATNHTGDESSILSLSDSCTTGYAENKLATFGP